MIKRLAGLVIVAQPVRAFSVPATTRTGPAMLSITIHGDGLRRFDNQIKSLGKDGPKVLQRAVARAGDTTRTQVRRALTVQTGLPAKTITKAIKVTRPRWTNLAYVMETTGGDISLKYFKPKETADGVSAAPWGKRDTFVGAFLRGGPWPDRGRLVFHGHAFHRTGASRTPIEMAKSGLYIPKEMVDGATAAAFNRVGLAKLQERVQHEIGRLLK